MERLNKRGQGMSLTTIILIVLGLAVLIFLIFGFTTGWGNLWSTITELGGGDANVDDVKRGCELACSTQSVDAYCTQVRTINYGESKFDKGSCWSFEGVSRTGISSCSGVSCTGTAPEVESEEEADDTVNPAGE